MPELQKEVGPPIQHVLDVPLGIGLVERDGRKRPPAGFVQLFLPMQAYGFPGFTEALTTAGLFRLGSFAMSPFAFTLLPAAQDCVQVVGHAPTLGTGRARPGK